MERYLPARWRLQQLFGVPEDRSLDGLYAWCRAVQEAVREILGPDHEQSLDMAHIRSQLDRAWLIVGWKRKQRMRAEVWAHRRDAHLVLQAAGGGRGD